MTPFYATESVTVYHGDCLDVLATLPDASVDAVVTDPPYGLEFMGQDWDGADGFRRSLNPADVGRESVFGRTSRTSPEYRTTSWDSFAGKREAGKRGGTGDKGILPGYGRGGTSQDRFEFRQRSSRLYQEWCQAWAAECLRVLKPGGFLLAFGGTRTYHRLTCAIEDAGFEVRDTIAWLYGCLTDDVDVLTERGWVRGIETQVGDRIAQWEPSTGEITFGEVRLSFRAPWSGDLVRFHNTDTDQAVTPNHRVWRRNLIHQGRGGREWHRWSDYRATEAAEVPRRSPSRLPLAGEHDGPGVGGIDYAALLGWVWTEGGFDKAGGSTGVRIYQSSTNQAKVDEIAGLMDRMGPHKRYDQPRTYTRRNGERLDYVAVTWFFTGDLAARVRGDLPSKRPTYDLLWRMTLIEKRAFIDAALKGDGAQQRNSGAWTFYQSDPADREWFVTALALVGWRGHDTARQSPRTGGSVSVSRRADTTLSPTSLRDDQVHYEGDVWCVQVPSGAFVARRHGKVFITGNSGFPKSLDVSKALDKAAGAERETKPWLSRTASGVFKDRDETSTHGNLQCPLCRRWKFAPDPCTCPRDNGPQTEDAKRWAGWGTALKPAHEPIVVARKPLAGTVAANVLTHGTGALNVDGCRVDANGRPNRTAQQNPVKGSEVYRQGRTGSRAEGVTDEGRWPTNVVLSHAPLLDESGQVVGDACADGCVPGCPVAELDRQSGDLRARGNRAPTAGGGGMYGHGVTVVDHGVGDSGGASRFFPVFRYEPKADSAERPRVDGVAHPTVKPLALMRWLVRLVTPPGGLVLDPFAGSGTTAEACVIEGFRCVAVEKEAEYRPLIVARLSKPLQPALDMAL